MAIEFVVEDGTRPDDANSYVTVAEYQQYWENRGVDYSALADATIQPLLIKATQYIDNMRFLGIPYTLTQSLQWPRVYMENRKGKSILTDEIPDELKNAVCEAAKYIYTNTSIVNNANNVRSKKIGSISVSFFTSGEQSAELQNMYDYLNIFLDRTGVRA